MADKKISQLTALSAANLAPSTDVLAIVDTSATETKKIVAQDLINGVLNVASAVGIGTASPAAGYKLDVNGSIIGLGTNTASSGSGGQLRFRDDTGTFRWLAGMSGAAGTSFLFYDNVASLTRLTIDSSGNLGLGVTPSAWRSTSKALQIGQGASFWANTANPYAFMSSNAFLNSSAQDIYIVNGHATTYTQQVGQHIWYTAPSGTAGNPISFTQAMTLDASGNLGVGITSPNSRLDVVGGTGIRVNEDGAGTKVIQVRSNFAGVAPAINVSTNDPLLFQTNNTERGRFTAGGYFKASNAGTYQGSTLAYHELRTDAADYSTIVGNTNASPYGAYILFGSADPNNSTNLFLLCNGWNGSSLATRATIRSNGGLANYQSNNVDLSDARTKKDIAPAASMWDKIGALEIVTYKYNDQTHDDVNVGVIAQQVESVEPVWVDADGFGETPEGEEPLKTVYTKDITFAAVKALQEAMARIEQLEADMAALKASA